MYGATLQYFIIGNICVTYYLHAGVRGCCRSHPHVRCTEGTWVLYRKQIRLPEQFHQRCLRTILGIKWQDHVSNEEAITIARLPSIESILLQVQLR